MSTSSPAPRTIGILGHYGLRNLGDEAIVAAVLGSLRRRCPEAELVCLSINPADSARRHGVPAWPIRRPVTMPSRQQPPTVAQTTPPRPAGLLKRLKDRLRRFAPLVAVWRFVTGVIAAVPAGWRELRFLLQSYQRIKSVDLLLVTGSGQLFDYFGGPWAFPYTLLKWSVLARLARTRLAFVSVGAGPIVSRLSCRFLRWSLSLAEYRSYRDEYSRRLVEERIGFRGDHRVVPDLACNLFSPPSAAARSSGEAFTVGINPIPYFDPRYWPEKDERIYRQYVERLAEVIRQLAGRGWRVRSFCTKLPHDMLVMADVSALLKERKAAMDTASLRPPDIDSMDALRSVMAACDIIVAARFHGILLPLTMGIPTIGLAYHPKTREMMEYLGVPELAMDIERFAPEEVVKSVERVCNEREAIAARLRRGTAAATAALEEQYGRLVGSHTEEGRHTTGGDGQKALP